ncbi:MAG: LuxR C-terminal-related transcriptional regulator [Chitinophagales bacterium]
MESIVNHQEPCLTALETDILEMIAQGLNNQEIAEVLCMDADSIEFYKKRMVIKMRVPGITVLLAQTLRNGLLIKKQPRLQMVA